MYTRLLILLRRRLRTPLRKGLARTNRIQRSFAGELALYQTAFGVEKRFLLLPRTYLAGGAAFGMQIWSVPSGKAYTDDDGEDHEISASAIRFGGVANGATAAFIIFLAA